MLSIHTLFILAAAALPAQCHYVFDRLVLPNGTVSESWQFVRENTRVEKYMPTKFFNSFGTTPLDTDFRCNQGSFTNAADTQVAEVVAGDTLSLVIAYGATMKHPGPAQVYLSRADGDIRQYDGSGGWFKVHQETVCGSTSDDLQDQDWCTWDKDRVSFSVPAATPNGEYLVRVEHIGMHGAHVGEAEFYYSCAQIRVTSGGTGSPGPLVKIPGVYDNEDPAIRFSIYGAKSYPSYPGPGVWNGDDTQEENEVSTSTPIPASSTSISTTSTIASISTSTGITASDLPITTVSSSDLPITTVSSSATPESTEAPGCPAGRRTRHRHRKHRN